MKNNLQDIVLNQLRRERQTVTVITINGYQIKGRIAAFDQFSLLIEGADGQQLTYKHAVSTIIPEKPVAPERQGKEGA